mmetsp:Transcript_21617/g.49176  ORF Transcript_21617/g.49176 Transcript_21617/m.49176 type:complete len:431 (-) Transcript_21617:212-1504(-)
MPPPGGGGQSSCRPISGGGVGGSDNGRPQSSRSVGPRLPTLLCNLCHNPLQTTCFLTVCDCVYCEECTYTHFQQSSSCPTCRRNLGENDFTEVVIAESTTNNEISKTSLQALFSKQPGSSHSTLPFSELCVSLVKQADVLKQSTKFILKQLIMDASVSNHNHAAVLRGNQGVRAEMTKLKQMHSTQRMELERANADLSKKLQARENTIKELHQKLKSQEKMLDQFRQHHGNMTASSSTSERQYHHRPLSSQTTSRQQTGGNQEPPLRGLLMQKEKRQQQIRYEQQHSSALGHLMASRSEVSGQYGIRGAGNGSSSGHHRHGAPALLSEHHLVPSSSSGSRPYSSSSTSLPNTPRIRELSSNSGYNFTSNAVSSVHINKRRRGGTPTSQFGVSPANSFLISSQEGAGSGTGRYSASSISSRGGLITNMFRR